MTLPALPDKPVRQTCEPEDLMPVLGIGRSMAYELIRTGKIRSIRVGRKILIPLSAIDEFLNGGQK